MEATDLGTFHRWLLADTAAGTPSIVIHGQRELPAGLAAAVARHLNEFDEDAHGNWLAFAPELMTLIAESATQRSLLGIERDCQCSFVGAACSHRGEVLSALAARGHAVLEGAAAMQACTGSPRIFRIWLGTPPDTADTADTFHLILHPEHFSGHSLPAIIGDTYLEWADARLADTAR
ncbi:hypothetical protein [Haloferula sp. BvORR071]|uniref:hypothetical protein n=1 Tax=Haloferula sp. BvORR071 TaxID=1396141 RepID=UPI0005578130|nr:hypothetical protein [Haloferula sp. BvORR071]